MKKFGRWGIRLFTVCLAIGWSLTASYYKRASVTAYSNKVDKNYVVVISIDALNARDFDTMKELPNFKKLIENGSYARKVIGVYPSLTYPSHVSIMTGSYPDKHGIVNNKKNEIGVKTPGWYWYSKDIKIPTVYDLAKEKNLTVGALAWPVTAGASIDYNYPEIWTTKPEEDETELISQNGTSDFVKFIRKNFGGKLKERQQPELDNFITDSAVYMVKNKKPNLALIHLGELDSKRHGNGADSSIVKEVLKNQDERIGRIIKASKEAGTYDNTTFIILGDHGFKDIDKKVNLNVAFKNEGLINTDDKDNITGWYAVVDSCDGAAYIYLKDKNDNALRSRVESLLAQYKEQNQYGIEEVYSKADIEKFRSNPEADYMLEAKDGFFFSNEWQGQAIVEKSKALGTHGYSPYKPDYNTFFLVSGAKANKGTVLSSINMVDEGPTIAKLLNLKMDNVDGKVLTELLK